ncbi:MAG TPA: RidA family protein [Mycobacteriales bacterium]|nr:RidA family protein [Mycobacteriales bacterium]
MVRQLISSNTPGEQAAKFSRAVRVGNLVFVSGTTAMDPAGHAQHGGDATAQARYILTKIEAVLGEAGASLADVVRTRIFVRHLEDVDAVARVHGLFFADVRPANTMLRGEPVDTDMLLEIEVDALVETD